MNFCCIQLKTIGKKKRKMNASFSASAILKLAQIWTPMRWGKLESNSAVSSVMFKVREHVYSDDRFYTLAFL